MAESNEINNASLSWGTVGISGGFGLSAAASEARAQSSLQTSAMNGGEAYNGKILPDRHSSVRKVRISVTPQGGRRIEFLDKGPVAATAPRVKAVTAHRRAKLARARQHVIFPVTTMKPMPKSN